MKRVAAAWGVGCAACFVACGGGASPPNSNPGAGSPDASEAAEAGTTEGDAQSLSADAATDGGSGGVDCTDRSLPACQPEAISTLTAMGSAGPTLLAGKMLTIQGRDVYWGPIDHSFARTSLDTGVTTVLPSPPSPSAATAFVDSGFLVHDAENVYAASITCCDTTSEVLTFNVASQSWQEADVNALGEATNAMMVNGQIALDILIALDFFIPQGDASTVTQGLYASPSNAANNRTGRVELAGTDGTTAFVELTADAGTATTTQLARLDGADFTVLTSVPGDQPAGPKDLVADARTVYFGSGTKILTVDRATPGTPATLLDVAPHQPSFLLVDRTSLYWVDDAGLHAIPKSGGTKTDLAQFPPSVMVEGNAFESVKDIDQTDDFIVWTGAAGLTKVHK